MLTRKNLIGVLVFLVFCSVQGASGDLQGSAEELERARHLVKQGRCDEAETIYRALVEAHPNSEDGLAAKEGLTTLYIQTNRQEQALAVFNQMLVEFAGLAGLPKAVDHIGDSYREKGKYNEALEHYRYVVATWPNAQHAIMSQVSIAKLYIRAGDDPNAQVAIDKLTVDFGGNPDLAVAVCDVAEAYRDAKKPEKAICLYEYVVNARPDSQEAVNSQAGIAEVNVELGREEAAEAAFGDLVSKFWGRDGLAKAVDHLGDAYREAKKYKKAAAFYKYVVDNWPNVEHAMWSQVSLVKLNIETGDEPNSQLETNRLITTFSDHNDIAVAVENLAEQYFRSRKYAKAIPLYEYVVNTWPTASHALWAQMGVAKSYICLGDDLNAGAAIEKLAVDQAGDKDLKQAFREIAHEYERLGKLSCAKELYGRISQLGDATEPKDTLLATAAQIILYIDDCNDAAAFETIDRLIEDCNRHPELARTVFRIGKKYYEKARLHLQESLESGEGPAGPSQARAEDYLGKTLAVAKKIIKNVPDLDEDATVEAYHLAAECYRRHKDYASAVCYYQEVVKRSPRYKYAGHSQFMVGYCYDQLQDCGAVEKDKAAALTRAAYTKLLENYANSPPARAAQIWLSHNKHLAEGHVSTSSNEGEVECACD